MPIDLKEATVEEYCEASVDFWADHCKIQLQAGMFTLEGHEYQAEILRSKARRLCAMKATQGGFTESEVLKALHGMIYQRYPRGVLYLFPTTDDVGEFSKSRFNPLIQNNRRTIGMFVKAGGRGTDTTGLKKIHDAFLYLRGARLSQKIGGVAKESSRLRSIPVDRIVFDEVDLMDAMAIEKALERMGMSELKEEAYISNPTIPDTGIHALFKKSDQRYLQRKCSCGHWTCAELSFPECVKIRSDGSGYVGCSHCGQEVGYYNAEWVPTVRDNSDYMHGYQWSQLSSPSNDPAEILAKFNDPPLGNIGDVYRLKLGLPYIAAEDRLEESKVYACCNNDIMPNYDKGPCAMGVDVGKIKHVVIGFRSDKDRFKVLKAIKLSRWEDIHDIARVFNVKSAVIDIRPYEDEARRFQEAEPYRTYLCEYTENPMQDLLWNDKTLTVKAYRTGIFDATHAMFDEKRIEIPRKCEEIDDFVRQVCGVAKVLETNQRSGTSVYRYRAVGSAGDHYRNAMNYFKIAAGGIRLPIKSNASRPKFAINNTSI